MAGLANCSVLYGQDWGGWMLTARGKKRTLAAPDRPAGFGDFGSKIYLNRGTPTADNLMYAKKLLRSE